MDDELCHDDVCNTNGKGNLKNSLDFVDFYVFLVPHEFVTPLKIAIFNFFYLYLGEFLTPSRIICKNTNPLFFSTPIEGADFGIFLKTPH